MSDLVRLDPESVQAVARAVVQMLRVEQPPSLPGESVPKLLTAAQVARQFGVSRAFVYDHADELGVVKIGAGSKPRLRFDAAVVERVLSGDALSAAAFRGGGAARTQARAIVADAAAMDGLDALPAAWRDAVVGCGSRNGGSPTTEVRSARA